MGADWSSNDWILYVTNPEHNHEATAPYAHPSLRKLAMTEDVINTIRTETQKQSTPQQIATGLRVNEPEVEPLITTKDISNQKEYLARQKLGRLSPIQALLRALLEGDWYTRYRKDPTDAITHLFFVKPSAMLFLRQFWKILVMDCTYKTNKYKLPLFVICGVTNLHTSFYLGYCFMIHEEKEDYIWALNALLDMLLEQNIPDPKVIITDRDLGLMGAIRDVFPESASLLCVWHINKNVLAACKPMFDTKEHWDKFYKHWQRVIYAQNHEDFTNEWDSLCTTYLEVCSDERGLVQYLSQTWIDPWQWKFVAYHTKRHMHFGTTVTSRVEGHHRILKLHLHTTMGDLSKVVDTIALMLMNQRYDFQHAYESAKASCPIRLRKPWLREIRSLVTPYALNLIFLQWQKLIASRQLEPCTNTFTAIHGLPCAHKIQSILSDESGGGVITLSEIDPHWRYENPPSYSERITDISDSEDIGDSSIDPYLQVREPLIGRERGRPRGSLGRLRGQRAQHQFDTSTQRIQSQFEVVEARLNVREATRQRQAREHRRQYRNEAIAQRTEAVIAQRTEAVIEEEEEDLVSPEALLAGPVNSSIAGSNGAVIEGIATPRHSGRGRGRRSRGRGASRVASAPDYTVPGGFYGTVDFR